MSNRPDRLSIDAIDHRLLALLRDNARLPVTSLAHALSLSRASVHARLARLERDGIIQGYTLRLGEAYDRRLVRAHVMLKIAPKAARAIERQLLAMAELTALYAISGEHDMIALLEADGVVELDQVLDRIGAIDGVERTTTSILLAAKSARGGAAGTWGEMGADASSA